VIDDPNNSYDPDWGPAVPECTIPGTSGPDKLDGTEGADSICAGAGDDKVAGKGGGDSIFGDFGNDTITGGAGADTIDAGPGDDTVFAADGERDTVICGPGTDTVTADAADDVRPDCETVDRGEPGGGGGPAGTAADVTKPTLSASTRKQVKRGRKLSLRYTLSEAATVTVTLQRAGKGRRAHGRLRQAHGREPEEAEVHALHGRRPEAEARRPGREQHGQRAHQEARAR
jgi:RTX calcium-binding nonapeptide repeat (4 copies)